MRTEKCFGNEITTCVYDAHLANGNGVEGINTT